MEVIKGQPISLSAIVTKNTAPVSGAEVNVTVLRLSDESTLLVQDLTETGTPGLYSYLWDDAPEEACNLFAMYTYRGRTYIEDIVILDTQPTVTRTQEIVAEIEVPETTADIQDNSIESDSTENVIESNIVSAEGSGEVSQTIGTAEVDQNLIDAETGC